MPDDDETITFPRKQFKTIIAGIVSGIVIISGTAGSGYFRVDPFRGSDAIVLKREIKNEIYDVVRSLNDRNGKAIHDSIIREVSATLERHQLESDKAHFKLESEKPPEPTRTRIQAIEQCIRKVCPNYLQPTTKW